MSEHGASTKAMRDRCTCDLCKTWKNTYMKWWRAKRLGRTHKGCPTCSCPRPPHPGGSAHE